MASAAEDPLTDDFSCAFCLQRLPYMADPRKLPCSHVFCLPCLKADFVEISATCCRICSKTHEIEDLDTLPVADDTTTSEDDSTTLLTKVLCDVCTGHKSTSKTYCCDCKKHYCEEHRKMHDVFLGNNHLMIESRSKSDTPNCQLHTDEPLSLACAVCHQMFCTLCDIASGCQENSAEHKAVRLEDLAKKLKEEINVEIKVLSEKITEDQKVEKCAWNHLSDVENKIDKMTKEVDRVTKEKILRIRRTSAHVKHDLRQYWTEVTEETEGYTASLLLNIGHTQNLWRSVNQLMRAPEWQLVKQQRRSIGAMKQSVALSPNNRKRKYPASTLNSIEAITALQSPVIDSSVCPTSIEFIKEISGAYHCVLWNDEGNLLAGGDVLTLFTRDLKELKRTRCPNGLVTSLAQLHFTSESIGSAKYAAVCSSDETCVRIFSSTLAAGDVVFKHQKIALSADVHPVTNQILVLADGSLSVFSSEGVFEYSTNVPQSKAGMHCLPDGSLLFSSKGITKYFLDSASKSVSEIWKPATQGSLSRNSRNAGISSDSSGHIYVGSNNQNEVRICSPSDSESKSVAVIWKPATQGSLFRNSRNAGISSDSAGHIYVGSLHQNEVYIFSPSGSRLQTLRLRRLTSSFVCDVAVSGTLLAVTDDEGSVSLFNLVREPPKGAQV